MISNIEIICLSLTTLRIDSWSVSMLAARLFQHRIFRCSFYSTTIGMRCICVRPSRDATKHCWSCPRTHPMVPHRHQREFCNTKNMNFNEPMSIVSVSSLLTHSQRSRQPPSATIRQRISPLNADLLRNYFLQLSHSQSPCDPNEPMWIMVKNSIWCVLFGSRTGVALHNRLQEWTQKPHIPSKTK